MPAMRILIIEDDRQAASYLVKAFREAGHVADHAADGLDGYAMGREGAYDVLVVDRMLPKLDGLSLIRSLREQGVDTPVLILSALGQVDDRVKGLRAGGDDYLPKPYAFSELLARVEVLVRRRAASAGSEPTGAPSVTRYQVWPSALALSVARIATDWPVSAPSRREVALGNSRRLKNDSVVVPSSGAPAGRAPSVTSKWTSS